MLNVIIGYIFGMLFFPLVHLVLNANFLKRPRFKRPLNEKHKWDFRITNFLKKFPTRAWARWYCARVTFQEDVLTSVLCTLGLLDIVCFYFDPMDSGLPDLEIKKYYHAFRSFDSLEKMIYRDLPLVKELVGPDHELFYIGAADFNLIWEKD